MSLEHFAVPGSKEVLNIEANKLTNPTMRISQRDTGANCRRSRKPKLEPFAQQRKYWQRIITLNIQ